MLYLFTGDDLERKNIAITKFIEALPEELPRFYIERGNWNPFQLESLYSTPGLFFKKSTTILTSLFDHEEAREFVLEKLEALANSQNIFIVKEGPLKKAITDQFKKVRAKIEVFEKEKDRKEKFNTFLLANSLGDRDKLHLWLNFRAAIATDVSLEELTGVLFWKVKDMLLKKNFGKYKKEELEKILMELSFLLPQARSAGRDAESALEEFLLEKV